MARTRTIKPRFLRRCSTLSADGRQRQWISHTAPNRVAALAAPREASGAIHESLANKPQEPNAGNELGSLPEAPERFMRPHESLATKADKPLRGDLLSGFHERFTRQHFFHAPASRSALLPTVRSRVFGASANTANSKGQE